MSTSHITLPKVPTRIKATNTKSEILSSYRVIEQELNEIQQKQTVLFAVVALLICLLVI